MRIKDAARPQVTGCVERVVGLRFDVSGLDAGVGDEVCIESSGLRGQVVALDGDGGCGAVNGNRSCITIPVSAKTIVSGDDGS